jgi:glycine/D-amino acid oxidase-like deaminating enzyme
VENRPVPLVVLGAGLQGTCVAFALAHAGFRVTLVDREPDALRRASLHNEGKIHLGFVYANDRTGRTSSLMLESAMSFAPLLREWFGERLDWDTIAGDPFAYVVLNDSLVNPHDLLAAWERLQTTYEREWRGTDRDYLGHRPDQLWVRPTASDAIPLLMRDRASMVIRTAERPIDVHAFAEPIRAALGASDRIRCLFGHHVRAVERTSSGFRIDGSKADGSSWKCEASGVVNCLWEGRLAIDREMGILPTRPWVYRLKYRILGQLPPRLANFPSTTFVLGRFGDVVNYGNGRVYLSWYPSCLRGWSSDVSVPESWNLACGAGGATTEAAQVVDETLTAFDAIAPGFRDCQIDSVAAGVIFSWGKTDIDDLGSELHRRDDIGPEHHDGYITVNTGKLTSAPLFAHRIVEQLR